MDSLYDFLVSGGCGGTVAYFVSYLHRKVSRREEEEGKAYIALMEKRVSALEKSTKEHGEMLAAVKTLAASVEKLSADIKEMIATNAAQSQAITNLSNFVANLREDLGEVRRDLKEHIKSEK